MRLHLFAVGRLKAGPERELTARYLDRLAKAGPAIGFEFGRLVEIPEGRAARAEARQREEAAALLKALPERAFLILLGETGKTIGSEPFAELLGGHRDGGRRDLVIAIGGADGHGDEMRARADVTLSFGRMTWPHQLVRIMASEQLYRAVTILSGHPYHRG
jgi:23S rRNA (pseudouridine1915-N3)-methyltransferase